MPIVEPDISLNGDYDLETAIRVNVKVQAHLYKVCYSMPMFPACNINTNVRDTSPKKNGARALRSPGQDARSSWVKFRLSYLLTAMLGNRTFFVGVSEATLCCMHEMDKNPEGFALSARYSSPWVVL